MVIMSLAILIVVVFICYSMSDTIKGIMDAINNLNNDKTIKNERN